MIFRKSLLEYAIPIYKEVFYDWWLALNAAAYGTVAATTEVLTYHRFHSSNLTLGKKDENRQTWEKAEERRHTLEYALLHLKLNPRQRQLGRKLHKALSTLQGKKFSLTLYFFLLRHASTFFYFKKKSWFSKAKMAWRLSFAL